MSYQTTYDKKRDELRGMVQECLILARELATGDDIDGFEEMPDDYGLKIYLSLKKVKEEI